MRKIKTTLSIIFIGSLISGCGQFNPLSGRNRSENNNLRSEQLGALQGFQFLANFDLNDPTFIAQLNQLPKCEAGVSNQECVVMKDSFERAQPEDASVEGFQWHTIIDDVQGANGERVMAEIYHQDDMGPTPDAITGSATDEHRALWFSGRKGCSVHSIYLISQAIDLSIYNTVKVAFQYLPVDLEMWNWNHKKGPENIRLEVCEGTLQDCGLGNQPSKINSNAWVPYVVSEDNAGDGLNGHNHSLSDWRTAYADINLQALDLNTKKNFVFRFAVTIDEGFSQYLNNMPVLSSNMIDGVAVDNVVVFATSQKTDDGPHTDDNDGSSF